MTMDIRAGSEIGGFILESYIGGGSFGAVWRGRDAKTDAPVAVKLLTGAFSDNETSAMRANMELLAGAAARTSEHIVRVLGGGVEPVPYIVMEYIEGSDLAQVIKDQGKLDIRLTVEIGLAVAGALEALFQAGIIHRDIKPANVMIDKQGVIKLADFGIAKVVGYETMTMTGQAAMTMAYAAPEVWDDGSPFGKPSHKSDLYAMGVLLYQCITGATPFTGNFGALYKAHTDSPPDMSAVPAGTPPSLRALIRRCLEKKQENRPSDASECVTLLKAAQHEIEAGSTVEPRQFGPWLVETPHSTQPWAWICSHESRNETATVEVHFSDDLDQGAALRRAVAANARLTPYGAERLIDSNRLLLRPEEAWSNPPSSRFQFWIARDETPVSAPKTVTLTMTHVAVQNLAGLVAAARTASVGLAMGDNLALAADGMPCLRRPGLVSPADSDPAAAALEFLRAQPLDDAAKAFLASADSLEALAALAGPAIDATVVQPGDTVFAKAAPGMLETVITAQAKPTDTPAAGAPPAAERAAASTDGVSLELNRTSVAAASSMYELTLRNRGTVPVDLGLAASSPSGNLKIDLPRSVRVGAGGTERVRVNVSANKARTFGGKRTWPFAVIASGDGANDPPVTVTGEFEEKPATWPIIAGAGGVAAVLMIAFAAVALGGGGDSSTTTATPTVEAMAVAQPTAAPTEVPPTLVPPTPVPVPPTPLPPLPPTPAPVAPVVVPAPVVVAPVIPAQVPVVPVVVPTPVPPPPPTPVPAAPAASAGNFTLVGFADHTAPGSFAPNDAVGSGGTVRSCNPQSLYAFVNFSNLSPPKQFAGVWTLNGTTINQQSFTQNSASASTFWQVQNSPTALTAGTYRFQMSVDSAVVTQGSFTLAC